jgi:hypothetical protein
MGFGERTELADAVVETLSEKLWTQPSLKARVLLAAYGYETHVPDEVKKLLRYIRTNTAKHVRFTPDFLLIDKQRRDDTYLLEYKATRTPIFSERRIELIRAAARNSDPQSNLSWQEIGQMEADAYDNYIALHRQLNLNVAVLTYCAYHERVLLCDFIQNFFVLHRDAVRGQTTTGSRTPFVNFSYTNLRSLRRFIYDVHGIRLDEKSYEQLCGDLSARFPVTHHADSPLHPNNPKRRKG